MDTHHESIYLLPTNPLLIKHLLANDQTQESDMEAPGRAQPHIAMFATTGRGHLFPIIEFARKLLHFHTFAISIIIPDDGSSLQPFRDLLQTLPSINLIELPPITLDDIPDNAPIEIHIFSSVTRSIPALCKVLAGLNKSARLTAFIADGLGSFTVESVKELGIPTYVFHTSTAMVLSLVLHLPQLDQSCTCEDRHLPEPVKLPGCLPLHGSDLYDPVQNRKTQAYEFCLELSNNYLKADGILINTFMELEPDTIKALEETADSGLQPPPVYAVGPLTRPGSASGSAYLKWLDEQPDGSVLYVSFGSGGTLSTLQLHELTAGLEMSEQRFLLVARRPNDFVRNGAYFSGDEEKLDPGEYLPTGFIERTTGKGFVVQQWASQVEILRHAAVGGFLTHCGWNSVLESIVHGVPMIAWPLYAEQKMNAVVLSEGLRVAERVRMEENEVVGGQEVARVVRRLMEGREMRMRIRILKEAAAGAMREDGSSGEAIAAVTDKWK